MTTNKIVNILGGGIFSAAILLLILWIGFDTTIELGVKCLSQNDKLELLLSPSAWILVPMLGLFIGFILSIVSPDEKAEFLYSRFGLFLGGVMVIIASLLSAIEAVNTPTGSLYHFPTIPGMLANYFIPYSIVLIGTSLICSIGYGLGKAAKGALLWQQTNL